MEKVLIVIPARYGSSRLPGKPLVKIKGIEMIKRVSDIADFVCRKNESCSYLVATDDERIVLVLRIPGDSGDDDFHEL